MSIVRTEPATSEKQQEEDNKIENVLRPKLIADFVGQEGLKRNLSVILQAAKKRKESAPHLLFYGPPGLGKTTLAGIVALEMGGNMKHSSGPVIEKAGDMAALLSNLEEGDVLFIDEIHRLRRPVEEILYSAMEDFVLDLIVGKGPGARSMRLQLPRFTLVAATTRLGNLSSPLRDRFGENFRLDFYKPKDISAITRVNAKKLEVEIETDAVAAISECSRGTPRVANRLLQRLRDYAHVVSSNRITHSLAKDSLFRMGVDSLGLNDGDRMFLKTVSEKFSGGPVGLSTLSAALSEEKETIEDIREPYLLQLGFLQRTPKGRVLSQAAVEHIENFYSNEE